MYPTPRKPQYEKECLTGNEYTPRVVSTRILRKYRSQGLPFATLAIMSDIKMLSP